jgi:dihydropteroate synthase
MKQRLPSLSFPRPQIMGIINVTPDSFSGDGLLTAKSVLGAAVDQAAAMLEDGADWLDIGGESSRPGSEAIGVEEEIRRVSPVVRALHEELPTVPISVDTVKPSVAGAALAVGASIINDISGEDQNPAMLLLAASSGAYLVLMHNRSCSEAVTRDEKIGGEYHAPSYEDVIKEIREELKIRAQRAIAIGVAPGRIILDPGLGFGKTVEQNLRLINELDQFGALGYPVLAGPSRKSFIGRVLDLPVEERKEGPASTG